MEKEKSPQEMVLSHTSQTTEAANIPIIDLSGLHQGPHARSLVIKDIGKACRQMGFFQVVNHGICSSVIEGALSSASDFFKLSIEAKMEFMSNDVNKPVRFGTSLLDGVERGQFRRAFLKKYAHPLKEWVGLWPSNPSHYRENMSKYALEVRKVATEIMGAITESLGLGPNYMTEKLEEGMQVIVSNFYPPCEEREAALGLGPHSDFGCITILLQNHHGLEIMDPEDGTWRMVPELPGALQVHVGDHLEVLSNGLYKSVIHRATLNSEKTRLSIASLHSLAMDEMIDIAKELVDDKHPRGYRGSTFREFLKFISTNDITKGSFIESLKIKK